MIIRMARLSISVPDELRERMMPYFQETNWSALACEAFERFLAEKAATKKVADMNDVIERLRASKLKGTDEDYQAGFTAGREWAKSEADLADLEALAAKLSNADWDEGIGQPPAYGWGECVIRAIDPEQHRINGRDEFEEFWDGAVGQQYPSLSMVHGFVDGAVQLLEAVEDRI